MKKTGTLLTRWLAAVCSIIMMISLFAVPAFADDANTNNSTTANQGLDITAIIWIVVGGILVIAAVVLGIKFRSNIAKGLRVYKSEFKKVSWLSWEQTRKSSLVVLVVLFVFAVVICLLDAGLFTGLKALVLNAFQFLP